MAFNKDYDAAVILAAAGATLCYASADGEVQTSVADRRNDLLLTHIDVPATGNLRFDRSLKPVATVAVDRHVAVGCAYMTVEVLDIDGDPAGALAEPIDDAEASADFRRHIISTLRRRLTEDAS